MVKADDLRQTMRTHETGRLCIYICVCVCVHALALALALAVVTCTDGTSNSQQCPFGPSSHSTKSHAYTSLSRSFSLFSPFVATTMDNVHGALSDKMKPACKTP